MGDTWQAFNEDKNLGDMIKGGYILQPRCIQEGKCISQSQISKVVFQICTDILSALNIVSACLGNQKGICQMVDMLGDGFISISHLALTGKGIGNL